MNKKGFTLVELLAVLVILSVILVIAVPKIISSINNAKKSAIDSSVKLIISQIKFKRTMDKTYDVSIINASNTYDELGIRNDIFSEIVVSIENENTDSEQIIVSVVGKDRYSGFAALGNKDEVNVYSIDGVAPTISSIAIDMSNALISNSVIAGGEITIEWDGDNADTYTLEVSYDGVNYTLVSDSLEVNSTTYMVLNNEGTSLSFRIKGVNMIGETDFVYSETMSVKNWSSTIVNSSTAYNNMYYYNGTYIAVGSYGYIAKSTNGTTWTSSKPTTDALKFIYNYNGVWVAGGQNGRIIYSTTTSSWTSISYVSTQYEAISEYNGVLAIVGNYSKISRTINGTSWSHYSDPYSGIAFKDVDCLNGTWIAVGSSGRISTSPNAISWTSKAVGTSQYNKIYVVNNTAFAIGQGGVVARSTDGINWTSQVLGTSILNNIYYSNGIYVIVGASGVIYTSTNGTDWIQRVSPTTQILRDVKENNGLWIAVGNNNTVLLSNDAINWQVFTVESPSTNSLYYVKNINGVWHFGGSYGFVGSLSL